MLGGESVEADVLFLTRAAGRVEGIGDGGLRRHASPDGFGKLRRVVIDGKSALVELLSVFQNVFADFSEVEIEVSVEGGSVVTGFDEGVEHPELDVFDVGGLEVGVFQASHHAPPA